MKLEINSDSEPHRFFVDIAPHQTIDDLKAEIKNQHGYDIDRQCLIRAARVFKDGTKTLEAVGLKDGDFLKLIVAIDRKPVASTQDFTSTSTSDTSPLNVTSPNDQIQLSADVVPKGIDEPLSSKALQVPSTNSYLSFSHDLAQPASSSSQPHYNDISTSESETQNPRSVPIDFDMFRRMFDQYPEMYLGFQDFLTEHAPHFRRGLRNNAGLMDELLSLVDPAPSDLETRLLTADDENNVQQLVGLGFTQLQAMGAYLLTDKNMEQATEYLRTGQAPASVPEVGRTESELLPELESLLQLHHGYSNTRQNLVRLVAEDPLFGKLQKNNPAMFDGVMERFITTALESCDNTLTEDDEEAVQCLVELGFPQVDAKAAYFTFEKNQELAADFLLNQQQSSQIDDYWNFRG